MTGEPCFDVAIVGAGHAGAQLAIALRQRGLRGSIGLIGDEADPPYERPPLSKDYLKGAKTFERLKIRPDGFWSDHGIDLVPGTMIDGIDAQARRLTAGGRTFGYGALVWAAGGRARRLTCPGHDLSGIVTVRTRADVDGLVARLPAVERVVIVGGGFIGLETAAVLSGLGRQVVVVEAQDRVLARVAGEPLSRFYEERHRDHGVEIRLGATVLAVEGEEGRVTAVRLDDGCRLSCEMVVVGIGIIPSVAPLQEAGASIQDGVVVDRFCRTSLPNIMAIGDCAAHPNPYSSLDRVRIESVQNANDQARTVAVSLTGGHEPYEALPWFWSDQYDLKLQTIGLSAGYDEIVPRYTQDKDRFSLVYLREDRVVALDCVNQPRDFVQGRALIGHLSPCERSRLADASQALKSIQA